jgi:hypothetical protein
MHFVESVVRYFGEDAAEGALRAGRRGTPWRIDRLLWGPRLRDPSAVRSCGCAARFVDVDVSASGPRGARTGDRACEVGLRPARRRTREHAS